VERRRTSEGAAASCQVLSLARHVRQAQHGRRAVNGAVASIALSSLPSTGTTSATRPSSCGSGLCPA